MIFLCVLTYNIGLIAVQILISSTVKSVRMHMVDHQVLQLTRPEIGIF